MSSEPKYTRLYIALYDTEGGNGKYHWALIIHDPWLRLSKRISLYQIKRTGNHSWALSASNNARLLARNTLLCLVELPYLTISPSLARRFFAAQSPLQGTTPLLPGQADWSGAQWVIRCLDQAVQHHLLLLVHCPIASQLKPSTGTSHCQRDRDLKVLNMVDSSLTLRVLMKFWVR
ncbi:hypothetical protein EV421DRAFT_126514 [Armillaria borealis]|uniref:Uncharacterized protein n=1 Tax=Armillaria borealis TaxID=47425 RepID=A0AA39MF29_9AGAR|nr:hypothetical protein EV421DRAFT_126514 [Armillaria borealis]